MPRGSHKKHSLTLQNQYIDGDNTMSSKEFFPPLTEWEATHKTLHLYSNVVGVVARAHAEFHPKWWHISLKV